MRVFNKKTNKTASHEGKKTIYTNLGEASFLGTGEGKAPFYCFENWDVHSVHLKD